MKEVLLVGGGNMAWHLAPLLVDLKMEVTVLRARSRETRELWPVRQIVWDQLDQVSPELVILAVADDAIDPISERLGSVFSFDTPMIHTSGATPAGRITDHFLHRGVLWPIRSLVKGGTVNSWESTPLVYFAETETLRKDLGKMVESLSQLTYFLGDEQRSTLHLCATISNNFVNALYQLSYQLCEEKDISFGALLPIIRATADRQTEGPPKRWQTGPAFRGDMATMERHLEQLSHEPELSALYRQLSDLIAKQ
jgi:hypothetical protein